ncbi:MAG: hypothetical protein H7836_12620 [Magnetococcus sp. YQC-3]
MGGGPQGVGGWSTGCGPGRLGGSGCQAWLWWHTGGGVAWLEVVGTNGGVEMLAWMAAFLVLLTGRS